MLLNQPPLPPQHTHPRPSVEHVWWVFCHIWLRLSVLELFGISQVVIWSFVFFCLISSVTTLANYCSQSLCSLKLSFCADISDNSVKVLVKYCKRSVTAWSVIYNFIPVSTCISFHWHIIDHWPSRNICSSVVPSYSGRKAPSQKMQT